MRTSRRGFLGMLVCAPLTGIRAFRTLPWKVSFKTAIWNDSWLCRLQPDPLNYVPIRVPPQLMNFEELQRKYLMRIALKMKMNNEDFMKSHAVEL